MSTTDRLRKVAWALTLMSIPIATKGIENFLSGVYVHGGVDQDREADRRLRGAAHAESGSDLALVLNLILPLTVALLLITP